MDASPAATVARAIADRLGQGLVQDQATAHVLASTLDPLDPTILAARLGDPDDLEAAPLRELLLFPGPDTALALEPVLGAADLDPTDAATLVRSLAGMVRAVRVLVAGLPPLTLEMAEAELAVFVGRLRPASTAPAPIRSLLAERFAPEAALSLAVACRHGGFDWTPPRRAFLTALLSRLDAASEETPDAVRFALGFLADLPPDTAPLDALSGHREHLTSRLRRAEAQAAALAGSNFETLLATGHRLPYLHAPDIARELALADRILVALTGRAGTGLGPVRRDLGTVADLAGLLDAMDDRRP